MTFCFPVTAALSGALALALSACASGGVGMAPKMAPFSQADLPAPVQVPAGHRVAFETAAAGDITYECRAKKDMAGQFEWVFLSPDAGLKGRKGERLGKYYGPPATWDFNDGSKVSGAQLAVAPNGGGNIPLQLVKANPAMGSGMAQGVSHIQRVATQGGVAPAAPCDASTMGSKRVVTYTADYIFWKPA
jgi:Protein of unknown function (DUF3455)